MRGLGRQLAICSSSLTTWMGGGSTGGSGGVGAANAAASASSSRINSEVAELAIERRAADAEAARDFGHTAAIMADGEADDVRLDIFQHAQMAVAGEQSYLRRSGNHLFAARLAERRREVGAASGIARLNRDVRE